MYTTLEEKVVYLTYTCYECSKEVNTLNKDSRCISCVTRRNEFNMKENTELRNRIYKLEGELYAKKDRESPRSPEGQ